MTEEEAKTLDNETVIIMERRARVMSLYRSGRTMRDITTEVKVSLRTIHKDIHFVFDGYKRIAARNAAEHIADALQRLTSREIDIEQEWEKSKGEYVETVSGRRAQGQEASDMASVKKRQRYGDPRLATLLLQCWDRRCKLLGLLSGDDLKALASTLPPVKMVKGINPAELV